MGVKIGELIIRTPIDFSKLQGKIITIDAPNIIFSLLNFAYKNKQFNFSNLMTDRTQRPISHLYGLLFRINFYYSKKIFPIFCFDGRVSELKRVITKDQLADFRVVKQWYHDAIQRGNRRLAREIALGKEFLWPNIIEESKKLLNALGVVWIESPASAESQCAHLVKKNIAHYVNSQDFDSLLFGCPSLLQNVSKSLKRKIQGKWRYKKITPLLIKLDACLQQLNLDQFQLVDLAILIGTDYNQGVRNIGPKTALKLLKKYHSLEGVFSYSEDIYNFDHLTSEFIAKVRKIFLNPVVLDKFHEFFWDPPNTSKIIELMCEDHTLNRERVENNINKLVENFSKCREFFTTIQPRSKIIQKTLDMSF